VPRKSYRSSQIQETIPTDLGPISFLFKRSSRRRTISICIDEKADIIVSAPFYSSEKDIFGFIRQKAGWIIDKQRESQENKEYLSRKRFQDGRKFLFLGKKYRLEVGIGENKRTIVDFDGIRWNVTVPRSISAEKIEQSVKKSMVKWYRQQAEEILGGRLFYYSRIMGLEPEKVAIKSLKRLWGNCDYNKRAIHLNWQVILSPVKVVDYIIVHELSHLVHPNHSSRFWKKVEKYLPDYKAQKEWLRENSLEMTLPIYQ